MIINKILESISMLSIILIIINPITYKVDHMDISNLPQNIYTLSIAMESPNLTLSSALSYDVLFGFEKTSDIARRNNALFGVNGMFYNEFGVPFGYVVMKGKVVSMADIGTPMFIIDSEGHASIEEIHISGKIEGETNTVELAGINIGVPKEGFVLFDSVYGSTTRVSRKSVNYLVVDNKVIDIIITEQPVPIENCEYILTNVTDDVENLKFEIGETIDIHFEYSNGLSYIEEGFQTGGWLVKDGVNISKEYEKVIGYTTAPSPRTLIGVTKDNKVILKVIDGRLPKESYGVSGYDAAELMIKEGCVNAAYLDGGASSTMVVNGDVVNHPSDEGVERDIAHAIIIQIE